MIALSLYIIHSISFAIFILIILTYSLSWKESTIEYVIFFEAVLLFYMTYVVTGAVHIIHVTIIMVISVCEAVVGLTLVILHFKNKNKSSVKSLHLMRYSN
uniref:NADH dehydrogenase subunit 4L n=1 Tax=Liposcelis decolor TaxID=209926 RepID=X2C071_9NEOP|nr:NADH dehydrogenase subunit 4L [Liposcelis decolor]AFV61887.1 NADH dehydrogenase subunit 4L [Liposcelis decolor]